jgi:YD repeat-containing protein
MKTRHILVCLALSLLGAGLQAQNDLPQVFSPNAAELGKYGKIPVSYFNGLPNITIPLTELRAKNYTLPIYLTYHAGGNKPDQHPGWVGLGWTLHAGGCINRIVNVERDEMGREEFTSLTGIGGPALTGYYKRSRSFQSSEIDSLYMNQIANARIPLDYAPDEFEINLDGLSSSFYLTGENQVKIKSKSPVSYQVRIDTAIKRNIPVYPSLTSQPAPSAIQYSYIRAIRVTDSRGVEYVFGDEENALELTFVSRYSGTDGIGPMICHVDTWNLSRITLPNGETIRFEYVKAGKPIVEMDRHYQEDAAWTMFQCGFHYNTDDDTYGSYSYTITSPSYLSRIYVESSGKEVSFHVSPSIELGTNINNEAFMQKCVRHVEHLSITDAMNGSYYNQLDSIVTSDGIYRITYTEDPGTRLKMMALSLGDARKDMGKYEMSYNPIPLPQYNSKHTDRWGFYSQSTVDDGSGFCYEPDEIGMQAEILQRMTYPTGGSMVLEYEAHHYGQIVRQYPFELVAEPGIAGGVRILRLTDSLETGVERRTFRYESEEGVSSGILCGLPVFTTSGKALNHYGYNSGWENGVYFRFPEFTTEHPYYISGERTLNQLPLTDGNHVTYSRIVEQFEDGSQVIYNYSNHEQYPDLPFVFIATNYDNPDLSNPFCSQELSRGLLVKKEYRSGKSGHPLVRKEEQWYGQDLEDYTKAIQLSAHCAGMLTRYSYIRLFTFFPGLTRRVITSWLDDTDAQIEEVSEYFYDSHRRIKEIRRTVSNLMERESYTFTSDYSDSPYREMQNRNILSYPVEHIKYRRAGSGSEERVIQADLTTWKRSGDYFVPSAQFSAAMGDGIPLSTGSDSGFRPLDQTGKIKDVRYGSIPETTFAGYDGNGNIVLTEDKAGSPTTYTWTPDGCHPAAIIPGARIPYERRDSSDVSRSQQSDLAPGDFLIKDFDCSDPFTMNLSLTCPQGQNWYLDVLIDGGSHPLAKINSTYTQSDWSDNGYGQYPSQRQVSIPSGTHRLRVNVRMTYYAGQSSDPEGCTLSFNYREKQYTTTVVPGQTVVFEDFEEDGNVTSNGYWSDRSHRGTWTHSLDTSGGPYVVDYRVFRNGRWEYKSVQASGTSVSINEGSSPIDHVRIYPGGSLPESYTWNDDGTLRSKTDARGTTESYRYDGLGRLTGVYDNEGHKVEGYQYNYKNR